MSLISKPTNGQGSERIIDLRDAHKYYKTAIGDYHAPEQHRPADRSRRACEHHWKIRERQVNLAKHGHELTSWKGRCTQTGDA
jgi:hypothetical protein